MYLRIKTIGLLDEKINSHLYRLYIRIIGLFVILIFAVFATIYDNEWMQLTTLWWYIGMVFNTNNTEMTIPKYIVSLPFTILRDIIFNIFVVFLINKYPNKVISNKDRYYKIKLFRKRTLKQKIKDLFSYERKPIKISK